MRTYERTGEGLDALRLVERPSPKPGPGQVLVRMRAASLNYRDLMIAGGTYGRSGGTRRPLVPLSDGAGEVVEVGPGVTEHRPGDRVMGAFFRRWLDGPFTPDLAATALGGGGTDGVLAEEVVLEADAAIRVPVHLSFEEASTLPCAGVTAYVGLFVLGRLVPDEWVLAMGTGGVSIFALQFAKAAGAKVVLTSSDDGKLARGKAFGADAVINYRTTPAWDEAARARWSRWAPGSRGSGRGTASRARSSSAGWTDPSTRRRAPPPSAATSTACSRRRWCSRRTPP